MLRGSLWNVYWFMLRDFAFLIHGQVLRVLGLTVILDHHKGLIEAAKEIIPLAKHRLIAFLILLDLWRIIDVTLSQARRGKKKALNQYQTCLEDHYGMLWSYASEILNSNPWSTCKLGVDNMPDGHELLQYILCCAFKGVKQGGLQGCRRVIGLDGCFLKTLCKGELLSAVGRDGNNRIYPIAWAVVSVENNENWSWFIKCLIDDLGIDFGAGLTIISDQYKGLIEAAKEIIPLA
ncbi:transposase, MuDR, plant [Tanacetum coccineum]